jgi:Ni,Fe-hydrogenase III small subunit/ferredoxin-like protein FixX
MFFEIIRNRLKQGTKTKTNFSSTSLPEKYMGNPIINNNANKSIIEKCANICPTEAISVENASLDLGKCIFCGECKNIENQNFISFENDFKMAATSREKLIINSKLKLFSEKKQKINPLFKRSLNIRQVSAGGCNACEADINVLSTPVFDLSRFGINFVASPRHADALLITGPITKNMKEAVIDTYNAIPDPKFVILVGACSISGGIFRDFEEQINGASDLFPIDLYIPGCPPHPLTIIYAILNYFDSPMKNIF